LTLFLRSWHVALALLLAEHPIVTHFRSVLLIFIIVHRIIYSTSPTSFNFITKLSYDFRCFLMFSFVGGNPLITNDFPSDSRTSKLSFQDTSTVLKLVLLFAYFSYCYFLRDYASSHSLSLTMRPNTFIPLAGSIKTLH
jgi:hypothetical protein